MLGTHVWGSGCREAEGAGEREGPGRCAQASALRWLAVAKRAGVNRAECFPPFHSVKELIHATGAGAGGRNKKHSLYYPNFVKN